jgi:thiamine-monophosphate kinase
MGIGDDTAVLELTPGALLLATTDLVVEDVHFRRASASWPDIGWKALAVNLSDIAAMGGSPRWALVALALPGSVDAEYIDALYEGMRAVAAPHGVAIVGGDTSASRGGIVINVTVLGEHPGTPRLRSMARPGDAIAVTGSLGRSAAGLAALERGAGHGLDALTFEPLAQAHRRPVPRVSEGRWLAAQPDVHALMDCSDGLATDLGHICRESAVRARIDLSRLPIARAVRDAARHLGADAVAWATSGGEDYELLLTCEPAAAAALADGLLRATGTALTVIGHASAGPPEIEWTGARGERLQISAGFEHFHG